MIFELVTSLTDCADTWNFCSLVSTQILALSLVLHIRQFLKFILNIPSGTFNTFDKKYYLRVIAKKILREFWQKHPDCEQQLKSWFQEASKAKWKNIKD
jgi:hypothetical protein